MSQTTLELKNGLKFYVSGQEITLALNRVNVSFRQGEIVAVTGESGSGKSTLAHILAGIFPCDQGELYLNGVSQQQNEETEWEQYRRNNISFVAQNYGILPGNTVLDNIIGTLLLAGMQKREAKKRAAYLLKEVDLWKLRRRKAGKLSSGQKQRLSVARAVAKPAPILIADEPTSNLDWRIASKIIKMLTAEAKHRLVIVVTHNFEIIQDYVTRNIELHDGEIVKDVCVESENAEQTATEAAVEEQEKATKNRTGKLAAYVAGLQTKARPVWTALMLLFFSLTAFAVFAFLGSFIAALDDTGTKLYSSELFLNGADTRLVVVRQDAERMSEEDYQRILTIPWITGIERYGVLPDINYHYREGVDYIYEIDSDGGGFDRETTYEKIPVLLESDAFLQTVPVMREGEEFLKAGRLPMHFNEVVAVGSVDLVGSVVDVYFHDKREWIDGEYVKETMKIVGVTEYGSGLYFDDRVGVMFWQTKELGEYMGRLFGRDLYYFVNQTAEEDFYDFYYLSNQLRSIWFSKYNRSLPGYLANPKTGDFVTMDWRSVEVPFTEYIGISEENFDAMAYEKSCFEISVTLQDYAYTDRAMEALEELGYASLSPYRIGSRVQDNTLSRQRLNTMLICMIALFVVIIAQVAVLAAMFGTQMSNYIQLRNLGLSYRIGRLSLWMQVFLFTVLGQVTGGGLIVLGASLEIGFLTELIKFLAPLHIVILSAVHLAASVLLAVVVCQMLKKKAFSYVLEQEDVDLAELNEAEKEA